MRKRTVQIKCRRFIFPSKKSWEVITAENLFRWRKVLIFKVRIFLVRLHPVTTIGWIKQVNIFLAKKFQTHVKFQMFYFGLLLFGHFLSHFEQISDNNFGHFAKTKLKWIYAFKPRTKVNNICGNNSFTYCMQPRGFTNTLTRNWHITNSTKPLRMLSGIFN